jgi:hypothetical protein
MPKQAISVTLRDDNLLWLRGRSRAARHRSVSETLDRLIADARAGVRASDAPSRSVKGTIRIVSGDPSLARADALVRALFRTGRGPRIEPARKRKTARG